VGRENPSDPTANLLAERLISNIYVADVTAQTVFNATQFSGALTENPVWLSDSLLAFNTNAGGSMDVWTFDILNQQLQQTTYGANVDNAAWLLDGGNGSNTP
jgi:Tol biopolymer transport system component